MTPRQTCTYVRFRDKQATLMHEATMTAYESLAGKMTGWWHT